MEINEDHLKNLIKTSVINADPKTPKPQNPKQLKLLLNFIIIKFRLPSDILINIFPMIYHKLN